MNARNSFPITTREVGVYDDDGHAKRTGTLWSVVPHIITAVIGSGVLSLAWSTAQLGWIGGPVVLICFAIITYVSASLLSDCYRTPDPVTVTGKRNYTYMDAVRVNLGKRSIWLAGFLQFLTMYGTSCAYVLTTAHSVRALLEAICYQSHEAPCTHVWDTCYMMMIILGVLQIVILLIPDVRKAKPWVSVGVAITYSSIGLGLGLAKIIENGRIMGSITGTPTTNTASKLFLVFQALGDISFSYPYALVLLEIQDTLESTPPENKTMKRASMVAITITAFFYLCCGCFGYGAFGNDTPGNLLTGFRLDQPFWPVAIANFCIILHLWVEYQMYSRQIFNAVDKWCSRKFPNSDDFANKTYTVKLPPFPPYELNLFRFCFRTAYVISTAGVAILFPYFNQVLGVLGAINFWPLAIYFPVEMYFVQHKVAAWSRKWIVLRTFSFACFLVSVVGLVGSIEGIISKKLS